MAGGAKGEREFEQVGWAKGRGRWYVCMLGFAVGLWGWVSGVGPVGGT